MSDFAPPDMTRQSLTILYRDAAVVVVNKPSGLLAVPGRGPRAQDSVITRLRALLPEASGSLMVHRLDMDTSGLMLAAAGAESQAHLSRQFETRSVHKVYLAVLAGVLLEDLGTIRLPMRLDPDNRPRQIHDPVFGKMGITEWVRVASDATTTRVRLVPKTGRTHQLRLHAAHPHGLGCPILGDRLYGDPSTALRLMLHAERIEFVHPLTGARRRFSCPAPF